MTALGDMCSSPHCSDLALPGQELCFGCTADREAERIQIEREVAARTEAHQALVEAQEQTT